MASKDFANGMDYGSGINDVSGAIRNIAVTGSPPKFVGTGGQTTEFRLEKLESVQDLYTSLGLSVDASGSYGLFSGSNKFDFAQSCHLHTYSLFLLVHVNVKNAFQQIDNEQLTPAGVDLLANGKTDRFREEFGDLYVKGIQTGGEYFAVLQITTKDQDDQQRISDKLEAGGGFGLASFDVAVQFASTMKQLTQDRTLHIYSFQRGGKNSTAPTDVNDVITKAKNFAAEVAEVSSPYLVFLQDYKALNLPAPPNTIDLLNAKEVLKNISDFRSPLFTRLNDIDYILTNPGQFETPTTDLSVVRNQLAAALNQLSHAASLCMDDLKSCAIPQVNVPDLSVLPKRRKGAPVSVPNLVDSTPDDAQKQLAIQGLQAQVHTAWSRIATGKVLEQDPPAGTIVPPGSTIVLTIGGTPPMQRRV